MADVAQAGTDLNVGARHRNRLVVLLQPEHHAEIARTENVFDREAPLDFCLARLVRLTVTRGFRAGAVAPLPFNGGAVILFEIVGPAEELGGEDDARRGHANHGCGLQRDLRAFVLILILIPGLLVTFLRGSRRRCDAERQRCDADAGETPQVMHTVRPFRWWLHAFYGA